MIFTNLPLQVKAVLEQDVPYKGYNRKNKTTYELDIVKFNYPKLYYIGQKNTLFTQKKFWKWFLGGAAYGLVIWIVCVNGFDGMLGQSGHNSDLWTMSITYYTCILLVASILTKLTFLGSRYQTGSLHKILDKLLLAVNCHKLFSSFCCLSLYDWWLGVY